MGDGFSKFMPMSMLFYSETIEVDAHIPDTKHNYTKIVMTYCTFFAVTGTVAALR